MLEKDEKLIKEEYIPEIELEKDDSEDDFELDSLGDSEIEIG